MRKRKRGQGTSGVSSEWMTTYSDLVTLLLCFFVLLYAFSYLDEEKFSGVMASFSGGSGVLQGGNSVVGVIEEQYPGLLEAIEEYMEENNLEDGIEVISEERGITIRFTDRVLFDPGEAIIKPESYEILNSIADILNEEEFIDKLIRVEGHADTNPVNPAKGYPTNWELSTARATNVLRYLVEKNNIEGERISASGYSFYRPIAPNDTSENRSKNRRVDIVILNSSEEGIEPE